MQSSSSRSQVVPIQGRPSAPAELITDPSGEGAFAEAMRELIAGLTPVEARGSAREQNEAEALARPARRQPRVRREGAPRTLLRLVR